MATLLYVLVTSLPAHIAAFFQYWHFPWRSKKLAAVLVLLNLLLKLWTVSRVLAAGGSVRQVEVVTSLLGAALYIALIRTDPFKLLFTYILLLDYLMVVRGAAAFLSARLFAASSQSWQGSLLCTLLYALSLPWLLHFFRRNAQMVFETDAPELWRTIWLVPALTSLVVLIYTNAYEEEVGNWSFLLTRLVLLLCIIVTYFSLLRSLEALRSRTALEEQARQSEQVLAFQRAQYEQLQSYMEEIRRARHDLRQHQSMILSYLESGDTDRLREYLQSQMDALPPETIRKYCRNYAINLLLNYYAWRFLEKKIEFEFQAELPERLPALEPDLCVVLGNLLENAQEACAGQEDPYVRAAARLSGSRAITLIVDNTAPAAPCTAPNGSFHSTKHEGSGIGTQSVRYIAQKYNGTADFRWENGVFYASVFLNPRS